MIPHAPHLAPFGPWKFTFVWFLVIVVGGTIFSRTTMATEVDLKRALNSINGNWYDDDRQAFVPPVFSEIEDHPVRQTGRKAGPGWDWQRPNWNFGWLGKWLMYTSITITVLVLLTCIVLLMMHFLRTSSTVEHRQVSKSIEIDLARVEDLPFTMEQKASDPLSQARRLADVGRYDSAIIYLYGYFLLALDQARKIHLQKGKTNRMYLRELLPVPDLHTIVDRTMHQFEEVYFGKHSISKESFEESWKSLNDFHRLLAFDPAKSDEPTTSSLVVSGAV